MQNNKYGRFDLEFDILSVLGEGGFGIVFEAEDKNKDKYAVKRIDLTNEVEPGKLAEREIKFKDLDHPNIVKFYNFWLEFPPADWQKEKDKERKNGFSLVSENNNEMDSEMGSTGHSSITFSFETAQPCKHLYVQMELCANRNLEEWLLESSVYDRNTKYLTIFCGILEGVEYLHKQGMIHRDLKPANILFGLDGCVKIGDFSTILEVGNKIEFGKQRTTTLQGQTKSVGTPSYRAPEIVTGEYDYRVDIYSLGVILFEMITPLKTGMERFLALEKLHTTPFPKECTDQSFEEEFNLFKSMLSKNPKERPTIVSIKSTLLAKLKAPTLAFFKGLAEALSSAFNQIFYKTIFVMAVDKPSATLKPLERPQNRLQRRRKIFIFHLIIADSSARKIEQLVPSGMDSSID
ncbi:Eukaryotic translation initiation factor 2-alpha kinase, partial [Pseudolycoriella hygida]